MNLYKQEQVPTGTTSIILRNLMPDTPYTVSVVPVYPAREGKRQSEDGKTCKLLWDCSVVQRVFKTKGHCGFRSSSVEAQTVR